MTVNPHWAAAYLGLPYQPPERDCWGFVRQVWAERFGLEVPAIDIDTADPRAVMRAFSGHPERALWHEVAYPREGDAALLAHNRHPAHVGLWIEADAGGVLHCQRPHGVIFTTLRALPGAGWSRLQYYRRQP